MSKRFLTVLVGLAGVGLLAACGDDGGSEPLTKAEFIEQGDVICAEGEEEAQVEAEEFAEENEIDSENPTQEQAEEAVAAVFVPSLRKQAEELSELAPPEGEEEQVEAIVSALEGAVEELEENPDALFEEGSNPLEEPSELAAEFGFEECGS